MQRISYASPSGEMYDQNYQKLEQENLYFPTFPPIPTAPLQVDGEGPQAIIEAENHERDEYSKMCKMWKEMTRTGIIYPVPVSLSVYIPADHYTPSPSTKNVIPTNNPPLASASLELFNFVLNGDTILDQTLPGFKNNPIPISEFIHDEKHWGSTLVPMEPNPNLYPDYELYKNALILWSNNTACEINDSSDLIQYGLPLSDYQAPSIITHGLKYAKSELIPIPKTKKIKNSFDPDFYRQVNGNKKPELFGEKRYFLKSSFPFLFDKKSASRNLKEKKIKASPLNTKPLISSLESFENGSFISDPESISELCKFAKFPSISPSDIFPTYRLPVQMTVGIQYCLKSFLGNMPKGYEYTLFHYICSMVNLFPSQMVSILSVDPNIYPVAHVAELYYTYGLVDCNVYSYTPPDHTIKQTYKNLLIFLYGMQTLSILKLFYSRDKIKKVIDAINKHTNDIKKSAIGIFNNDFPEIEKEIKTCDKNIIHLLIEYFPDEFASKFTSFINYLGSLNSNEFGHIAAHIFAQSGNPLSTPHFTKNFIDASTSYIKNYRLVVACGELDQHKDEYQSFVNVCDMLTFLLKFKNSEKVDATPDAVMSMLGAVNQLASINSKIAAPLATAILSFFTLKIDMKGYKTMKEIFMNSVMTIFEFHDLDKNILIELFEIVQAYLKVSSFEVFENFFNQILLDKMILNNDKISKEAWKLFRNVACSDFAKKIVKSQNFKDKIESIKVSKLTIPAKLIVLLIVKKSLLELPSDETYKQKNVVLISSLFSQVDPLKIISSIESQPKFEYENKILQSLRI